MRSLVILAVACAAVVALAQTPAPDHCAQYPTCQTCVAQSTCGWCSENVTLPSGATGAQCAGFNPNGTDPFSCNGIYSTEQCVAGYLCNETTFQCELAAPGQGNTLQNCEANCTNNGQVFLCNETSHQCMQVPQGQPNNGSYAVCEALCNHPSSHPSSSSPGPAPSPPPLYACNQTTGTCDPAPAGKGSSLQVCEQQCQQINGSQYMCNSFLQTCEKLPPGVKGETLAQCEAECNPKPTPGPPSIFAGMWRGIWISQGYAEGEWDFNFTQTTATIVDVQAGTTIRGTPYTQTVQGTQILVIDVTSGPGTGQQIKAIGVSANRGPETYFLTGAFGAPGAVAPASIVKAWTDGASKVFQMSQCAGTPECVFVMPTTDKKKIKTQQVFRTLEALVQRRSGAVVAEALAAADDEVTSDPCSAYNSSCAACLAAPVGKCGWCSVPVTYAGGVPGTQCAGFPSSGNSTPFVCQGRYSTFNCTEGYDCVQGATPTCKVDPIPGNGVPLSECETLCKPTPPPTPAVPQYFCNITLKQCFQCPNSTNGTFCPGAMSQSACAAACIKPKPGPSGLVSGYWRGLEIQNSYPLAEVEVLMNNTGAFFYKQGTLEWAATVESYGGDLMVLTATSGPNAGKQISGIYSVQNQGGPQYEIMTLAFGQPDGAVPDSYAGPMETTGEREYVLSKCVGSPCSFTQP